MMNDVNKKNTQKGIHNSIHIFWGVFIALNILIIALIFLLNGESGPITGDFIYATYCKIILFSVRY